MRENRYCLTLYGKRVHIGRHWRWAESWFTWCDKDIYSWTNEEVVEESRICKHCLKLSQRYIEETK